MDKTKEKQVKIVLPSELKKFPIQLIYSEQEQESVSFMGSPYSFMKKYAFILYNKSYRKIAFADIMWLEADRSYCKIIDTKGQEFTISFPMAEVERILPPEDFIRIHHSCIVNLKYVDKLIGNCLCIGSHEFTIGRTYREQVLSNFIFLGTRRNRR